MPTADAENPETADITVTGDGPPQAGGSIIDLADRSTLAYSGIVLSSIVLLVALCVDSGFKNHKYFEYGIAVASVAMCFALVGWGMGKFNLGSDQITKYNNYFLFVWCFTGACFLTFGGPFTTTGNGYFAAWGLAICATMALGINASDLGIVDRNTGPTMGLLTSAIVTLAAIVSEGFDSEDEDFAGMVYGMCLTCFTILVVVALMKLEESNGGPSALKLPVLAAFGVMWLTLACLLTFRGPFLVTGNGYFASWAGAVTSLYAANAAREATHASSSS